MARLDLQKMVRTVLHTVGTVSTVSTQVYVQYCTSFLWHDQSDEGHYYYYYDYRFAQAPVDRITRIATLRHDDIRGTEVSTTFQLHQNRNRRADEGSSVQEPLAESA